MKIIGREKEKQQLKSYFESEDSEFVAVYGRRRIGKTFLVNVFFAEEFDFSVTALAGSGKNAQLENFRTALRKYGADLDKPLGTWYEAFEELIKLLDKSKNKGKKIVFIDELPWFDTTKSGFLSALEHFWNGWAAKRHDILFIVCGSATSWMIGKLIRNKGGLHNRVTGRMHLEPFTLKETEAYLIYRNILWERFDVAVCYMVFGGVPFYLKQLEPGRSAAQNIDRLCFEKGSFMESEFDLLFASLFRESEKHLRVMNALSAAKSGLTRDRLLSGAGLNTGGMASNVIEELELCGFIEKYNDFTGKNGRYVYHISDFFSLFYYRFMKGNKHLGKGYWLKVMGSGSYHNWLGKTFELLCLTHIDQIRSALGIAGVLATPFSWSFPGDAETAGAQIDLLIDRSDNIINVCECKFMNTPYSIDASEAERLRKRIDIFKRKTKTRKAIHLTMITVYGLINGKYSTMVQSEVRLDDLFS